MIVIIDYDMGNVGSIQNILKKIGVSDIIVSRDKDIICKADKLILPGVGAFDAGMRNLQQYELVDIILFYANKIKKPILGICLGMQLLGRQSEEGKEKGLGLIEFDNVRFSLSEAYKIPHMGWDYIDRINNKCLLTENMSNQRERYYFVHSYHAVCDNEDNVMMTCNYGYSFPAAVFKDNIYGVQFHPEKSHQYGIKLLSNFVKIH